MYKLTQLITGKSNISHDKTGVRRSTHWAEVRNTHLSLYPTCSVCGSSNKVEVHHIIPFHIAPELELDPINLITLCEGWKNCNCHLVFGHLGNYKQYNGKVREIANVMSKGIINNQNIL